MILNISLLVSSFAFSFVVLWATGIVLDYEFIKSKLITALGLLACTAIGMFMAYTNNNYSHMVKLLIAIGSIVVPSVIHCVILNHWKLNILYAYALGIVLRENTVSVLKIALEKEQQEVKFLFAYALTALLIFALIKLLQYKKWITVIRSNIKVIPVKLYIVILLFLYLMSCFEFIAVSEDKQDIARILILPVVFMSIFIIAWIMKISVSEREHQNVSKLLEIQLANQLEHYNKVNDIYSEFRAFRHDLNNHLICLRSYISDNSTDEALAYIEEISNRTLVTKKTYDTGNIMADALLNDKNDKAVGCNTHITFSGFVPTMGITSPDLCTIMANALDNAIEACAKDKSDDKKEIKVSSDFCKGYFFFKVTNPVFDKVEIKNGNQVRTSKKDSSLHGFGVANIVKTVEKYSGKTELSVKDGEFILDIQLMLQQNL